MNREMEISFAQVRAIWDANAGKTTGGILGWFSPPVTKRWVLTEIRADEVGGLRFIGEDPDGCRGVLTKRTYKIADADVQEKTASGFIWNDSWHMITVMDPENRQRVILDGNERALQVYIGVSRGTVSPDLKIKIVVGELNLLIVRIAKAVSPLWR